MKPEILLKAYIQYQSEDAFRELVAGTLDEVYTTSLRIAQGAPRLAEEIALIAYLELAFKAPGLSKDFVLASWLRERTCKIAVRILRDEERAIDWAAVKREKKRLPTPADVQSAPPGLAIRIRQNVFLSTPEAQAQSAFLTPAPVANLDSCVAFRRRGGLRTRYYNLVEQSLSPAQPNRTISNGQDDAVFFCTISKP